jgi:hypothetical protein
MAIHADGHEARYTGAVLRIYNRDYRAMSDVYTLATFADVWSDSESRIISILVNANFECDQSNGRAEVDATEETLAKVAAFKHAQEMQKQANEAARKAHFEKTAVRVGRIMKVVKGRKVKPGTTGIVALIWEGSRALLKDPNSKWQDRSTPGTWVDCKYLEGV